jgi:hypothetical protein
MVVHITPSSEVALFCADRHDKANRPFLSFFEPKTGSQNSKLVEMKLKTHLQLDTKAKFVITNTENLCILLKGKVVHVHAFQAC